MFLLEFSIAFEKRVLASALINTERALEHLVGAIQEAYYKKMIGSHGGAGSVGALTQQIQQTSGIIEGIIGFGKSGDHLKYMEFGVAPDDPEGYPRYKDKPAPVLKFAEWIRRARLSVPDRFRVKRRKGRKENLKRRQEIKHHHRNDASDALSDEQKERLRWAWAMVIKRKKFGYRGLHIIEKIFKAEEQKLREILNTI
jgi:hypothetical protein